MNQKQHCHDSGCAPNECRLMWRHGGIDCAEVARRKAVVDAEQRERFRVSDIRQAIADELGDTPPLFTGAVGMPRERAMLARNKVQLDGLCEKLAGLEAKAEKFQRIIEAPNKSEQTLVDRIADLAKRFMESGPDTNGDDNAAAARAQMQFLVEQKAAESATAALKEVEFEIERQRLRIEHVEARHGTLVDAAIKDELGRLGAQYMKNVIAYKKTASLLYAGLRHIGEYKGRLVVELPQPGLDVTKNKPEWFDATVTDAHERFFQEMAAQLAIKADLKIDFASQLDR
jgi:hypothetical protein